MKEYKVTATFKVAVPFYKNFKMVTLKQGAILSETILKYKYKMDFKDIRKAIENKNLKIVEINKKTLAPKEYQNKELSSTHASNRYTSLYYSKVVKNVESED